MPIDKNEINQSSRGGTELMIERLQAIVDPELLAKVQIIPSRVRTLDQDKPKILWCHDLPDDPESNHLAHGGWRIFHKIVFVSWWQRDQYIARYQIPYSKCVVIRNAIEPIAVDPRVKFSAESPPPSEDNPVRIIYHTTPHRGLDLAVPVIEQAVRDGANIHFDVFSSFKIYGWEDRDEPFKHLFDKITAHPNMTYHGFQPNEVVRDALVKADIMLFPSIWPETSCLALIEALSAGCLAIHSDFGALPETSLGTTFMYPYDEDPSTHASSAYSLLRAILPAFGNREQLAPRTTLQKAIVDATYSLELRKMEWNNLLAHVAQMDPAKPTVGGEQMFQYNVY